MHNTPVLILIEKITFPISYPMTHWMPIEKAPEFVFLIVLVLFFFFTEFILDVVDVFALKFGITYTSIAFTLMAWGANSVDMICMTLAFMHGEE